MATNPAGHRPELNDLLDSAAFGAYRAALRAFVARRVHNRDEAEDLVQEACARLLDTARSRTVDEPQAYLFRIAANLIADRHRRQTPLEAFDESMAPAVRAEQEDERRYRDLQQSLENALAELPSKCRQVFIMRRFDERSTSAIALELRISPRMVQKYLVQAVTHLYDRLGPLREHVR